MSRLGYLAFATRRMCLSHMGSDVGQIESIIGVQWGKKNQLETANKQCTKQ